MNSSFFRYPHTPHITWLSSGLPRDDKVLTATEAERLLSGPVVVEEKVDGANLGFSLAPDGEIRVQNRGEYLERPFSGQFKRLGQWLDYHEEQLFEAIGLERILFGEWCAARHSIRYDRLPDWWLLFDVYDRPASGFWSSTRRNELAATAGVAVVATVHTGVVTIDALKKWARETPSRYRQGNAEGLVVRREDARYLRAKGKVVDPAFAQTIEQHWRTRMLEWNDVAPFPQPFERHQNHRPPRGS